MTVRVFVTVGTDHHPFDRLIDWIDDWAASRPAASLVVQHGSSRASHYGENHPMMTQQKLEFHYTTADIVVAQVGPGTISDANRNGIRPVTVPRDPDLGEVVDGHQFAFGEFMSSQGRSWTATTENELTTRLDSILTDPDAARIGPILAAGSTSANLALLVDRVVGMDRRPFDLRRFTAMMSRGNTHRTTDHTRAESTLTG